MSRQSSQLALVATLGIYADYMIDLNTTIEEVKERIERYTANFNERSARMIPDQEIHQDAQRQFQANIVDVFNIVLKLLLKCRQVIRASSERMANGGEEISDPRPVALVTRMIELKTAIEQMGIDNFNNYARYINIEAAALLC